MKEIEDGLYICKCINYLQFVVCVSDCHCACSLLIKMHCSLFLVLWVCLSAPSSRDKPMLSQTFKGLLFAGLWTFRGWSNGISKWTRGSKQCLKSFDDHVYLHNSFPFVPHISSLSLKHNKKLLVGASIDVPECPPQPNITRGRVSAPCKGPFKDDLLFACRSFLVAGWLNHADEEGSYTQC